MNQQQRLSATIVFFVIVMAMCALVALSGCGAPAPAMDQEGQLEESISTYKTSSSYVHGTCMRPERDRCRTSAQCPGGVACIVPATKHTKFFFTGTDEWEGVSVTSWKNEFRRILAPTYPEYIGTIQFSNGTWTGQEVSKFTFANLRIERWPLPCYSAECAGGEGAEVVQDIIRITEPNSANRVTLSEFPAIPGTYTRPKLDTTQRLIEIDVDRIWQTKMLRGMSNLDVHQMMEHAARWAIFSILGMGSDTPERQLPASEIGDYPQFAVMNPKLYTGFGGWDHDNWPRPVEMCLLNNYTLGASTTTYIFTSTPCP